jgi:hypothetical protein
MNAFFIEGVENDSCAPRDCNIAPPGPNVNTLINFVDELWILSITTPAVGTERINN